MANFDATTRAKIESVQTASSLIRIMASVYLQAKNATAMLTLYQGGTDPIFNAAVNAMLSASERQELAAMATDLGTLITAWEANHSGVIGSG